MLWAISNYGNCQTVLSGWPEVVKQNNHLEFQWGMLISFFRFNKNWPKVTRRGRFVDPDQELFTGYHLRGDLSPFIENTDPNPRTASPNRIISWLSSKSARSPNDPVNHRIIHSIRWLVWKCLSIHLILTNIYYYLMSLTLRLLHLKQIRNNWGLIQVNRLVNK